jgi:hypothetical protein
MDKANKMNITKEELILLKKEYQANVAKNPPKEIKRLPTLFEIPHEENEVPSANLANNSQESEEITPLILEVNTQILIYGFSFDIHNFETSIYLRFLRK